MKIEFETVEMADKAIQHGIRLFRISVASHQITKEKYTEITYCLRCYALEQHLTKDCPKPREHKACSECASDDHTWSNCTSTTKKCLNCGGPHRTMAFKCPTRKLAVNEKLTAEEIKKQQTFSQAAAATPTTTNASANKTPD